MTHKEGEKGRETLNEQIKNSFLPTHRLEVWRTLQASLPSQMPRPIPNRVLSCCVKAVPGMRCGGAAITPAREEPRGGCPDPHQHWQNAQDLVDFSLQ